MSNVDPILRKALEASAYADMLVIPADVDWTVEICNLINMLKVEAFQKDGQFSLEGINLATFQQLTEDNVKLITESRLLMANLSSVINKVLVDNSFDEFISIPADIDWTNEIYNVIKLLNIGAFQNEENQFSIEKINLQSLQNVTDTEIKYITESRLIMVNVTKIINKILIDNNWNNLITFPTDMDWTIEIVNLFSLLKVEAFQGENGFDIAHFTNFYRLLSAVQSLGINDIKLITESRLLMANMSTLIDKLLVDNNLHTLIKIPAGIDWTSELYRLVEILNVDAFQGEDGFEVKHVTNFYRLLKALQSVSPINIEIITKSNLIMMNLENLLRNALASSSLASVISIPYGIDWTDELYRIVSLLNVKAFWNEEGYFDFEEIKNIANVQKLSVEDIEIITTSRLMMANLERIIQSAIGAAGLGGFINVPFIPDWTEELYRIVQVANIDNFWNEEGIFDYNKFLRVNSYRGLTDTQICYITESRLFLANVDALLGKVFEKLGSDINVTIPTIVTGEAWADEISVVIEMLEVEAFHDEVGQFSLSKVKSPEAFTQLTSEDIAILTESKIFMANIDMIIRTAISKAGFEDTITLPKVINWESEIQVIGEIFEMEAFQDENGFKLDLGINTFQSLSDDDIDTLASSQIFNACFPQILDKVFSEIVSEDTVEMPVYCDWAHELKAIRDLLNIDAFQGENGFDGGKLSLIETYFGADKVALQNATDSKIFIANIETLVNKLFVSGGIEEGISVPANIDWKQEIGALIDVLQLLDDGSRGNENSYYVDKLSDVNTFKAFTIGEADTFTSSIIVVNNIEHFIEDALTSSGNSNIVIPENVEWANKYENGQLVEEGELWKIIQILNIEALQDENGKVELSNFDYNVIKKLDAETKLVAGQDRTEVDLLASSQIFGSAIGDMVEDYLADTEGTALVVPENIVWASEFNSDGKLVKSGELVNLVKVLQIIDANDMGISSLQALNTNDNDETTVNGVEVAITNSDILTSSAIIMANIDSIVRDSLAETGTIVIPSAIEWANTYDGNTLVSTGELYALIKTLNVEQFQTENAAGEKEFDESKASAVNSITCDDELKFVITNSIIIRATMSKQVTDSFIVPQTDCDNKPLFDGEYVSAAELIALLEAVESLHIKIEGKGDGHGDTEDHIAETPVNEILANMPTLLASGIVHHMITDEVIKEDVVVTSALYDNYMTQYISKAELTTLVETLVNMGLTQIHDVHSINLSKMKELADNNDAEHGNQLARSLQSDILCYIYSELVLADPVRVETLAGLGYVADTNVILIEEDTNGVQSLVYMNIYSAEQLEAITLILHP